MDLCLLLTLPKPGLPLTAVVKDLFSPCPYDPGQAIFYRYYAPFPSDVLPARNDLGTDYLHYSIRLPKRPRKTRRLAIKKAIKQWENDLAFHIARYETLRNANKYVGEPCPFADFDTLFCAELACRYYGITHCRTVLRTLRKFLVKTKKV